jgi:hypothetical protein
MPGLGETCCHPQSAGDTARYPPEQLTASFASRGSGVQIPSAQLGIAGQCTPGMLDRPAEDHLSPRCHWDRTAVGGTESHGLIRDANVVKNIKSDVEHPVGHR